jgi:hypothetical protein
MELKRIYDHSSGEPKLDHVTVNRVSQKQNFSQKFINESIENGLMSIGGGVITMHTKPGLKYRIVRKPGHYCCFDDKKLSGEKAAKKYVAENFAGKESPDSNNPAGYRKDNFFACELIKE